MSAQIVDYDHPYYAISDQAGKFEIKDVPVGTHTVKVWHPVLGELTQTVTVKTGAATAIVFGFSPPRAAAKTE
jgi:hypothetical protein